MKFFIAFALFVAAATALPVDSYKDAQIKTYTFDNIGVNGYSYGYETSDGKSVYEQAVLKNAGTENEVLVVTGSYSYLNNDGSEIKVTYTADEKGFQPFGAHLPQGPSKTY